MAKGAKRKISAGDLATNRQASFRYELSDKMECGIVLLGTEVKSVRAGQIVLKDGFVLIRDGELFLMNVHIAPYGPAARENHELERPRKLLAKAYEIERLRGKIKEKGLTLVPTRVYLKGQRVKVEIAVGRGKDLYDKRQAIKKRDSDRDVQRQLRDVGR